MDHSMLVNKFKELFPQFNIISHKRIDAHTIEIVVDSYIFLWTWYNDKSFKLETK